MKTIILLPLIFIMTCKNEQTRPAPTSEAERRSENCDKPLFVMDASWTIDNSDLVCRMLNGKAHVDISKIKDVDDRIKWLRKNQAKIDFELSQDAILYAHKIESFPTNGFKAIKFSEMEEMLSPVTFSNSYDNFMKVWIINDKVEVAATSDFNTNDAHFSFPFILAAAEKHGIGSDSEFEFNFKDDHMYIRLRKSGAQDAYFNISTDPALISKE